MAVRRTSVAAAGHAEDVEGFVQLGEGESAVLDVAAFEDDFADGFAFFQGLFGDGGGFFVAEVAVEGGDDGGGGLGVFALAVGVGDRAGDDLVGQEAGDGGEEGGGI